MSTQSHRDFLLLAIDLLEGLNSSEPYPRLVALESLAYEIHRLIATDKALIHQKEGEKDA
jgi:hypothetical protein